MTGLREWTDAAAARLRAISKEEILILSVLATVVGAGTGGIIILFREGIGLLQLGFWGIDSEYLASHAMAEPWWRGPLALVAGGLLVGLLIRWTMPDRRPVGVADAMEASALKSGRIDLRSGLAGALVSAVSIGAGASVGREGPAVHLGATLGSWLARRLNRPAAATRTLLGCGVAAAVASSFNAPIAGALFANEVVIGHYGLRVLAPVVIASVVGTAVSHAWFGEYPAFPVAEHPDVHIWELPAFALLGIIAGLVAVALVRGILVTQRWVSGLPGPVWIRPAIGGLIVGVIAIPLPGVLGVGYEVNEAALAGIIPLGLILATCLAKTIATILSLGFGFGGGVFSPSLVIGATLGGAYGYAVTAIFPGMEAGHDAYTLIGMGAVAAAVLGAPISTTLIVFELTGDYNLTMVIMLASVLSTVVGQTLGVQSFFYSQLEHRGLDLQGGFSTALLRGIPIERVLSHRCEIVNAGLPLPDVRGALFRARYPAMFVVDDDGRLVGSVRFSDLDEIGLDPVLDPLVKAADVARRNPRVLTRSDDLETVLDAMASGGEMLIPVVENADDPRFIGCVHERDAISTYNRALIDARRAERT